MNAPDHPDPWASLAESLGVGPGAEPPRDTPPPPRPSQPAPRAAGQPKPKPAAPPPASWDALAADLGIQPAAGEPPPRPAGTPPRRAAEPVREFEQRPRRDDLAETSDRVERRRAPPDREPREARGAGRDRDDDRPRRLDDGGDRADDRDAPAADGDAGPVGREDDRGERRGRRRRSRRGGRGRRDREAATGGTPREALPAGLDRDAPPRGPEGATDEAWDRDGDAAVRRVDGEESGGQGSGATAEGRDDDRPRRRGRRGRRGGRGRSRGQRGASEAPAAGRTDDLGDEPLPTSYGMRRPADAGEQPRDQSAGRRGDGDRSGTGSSRGRRRRRGGEGRGTGAAGESGRGRRSRRSGDELSRSSRVARADFAPVSGTYDEDDEGLEFLGLEEADRGPRRREARAADDDVLAESGLDSVREVPSWVEAIGIVIAGNLDARTRGRGDGGGGRHRDR